MDNHQSLPNELIEAILTQVDMQTVLLAQRVSRQWSHCIQGSLTIQRNLFFQPAPAPASATANNTRQKNPLLAKKFPYWFPADDTDSCAMAYGAGDMQDFLEISHTYRRPEASWRRMLVQQPPIMTLGWVERSVSESEPSNIPARDLYRWEIPLNSFGGLRMNMLYDIVMGISEFAPEYFYFRVLWSSSKSLSSRFSRLISDPSPVSFSDRRVSEALWDAMRSADVVLDMWYTSQKGQIGKEWERDVWTWELVRGLKIAVELEDFDIDFVRELGELVEAKSWSLGDELADIQETCGGMPLPDGDDEDL